VPVNELASVRERAEGYVILGAGKTAMDACVWLLQSGVSPSAITWIKPREAWLQNRVYLQAGELVGTFFEGIARQLEAAVDATSIDDLFLRLEAAEQFMRVDARVTPSMYRGPTLSELEVQQLRRIENVVRLGKVRKLERSRIVLDQGSIETSPARLHVHCASLGIGAAEAVPIFESDRIILQSIRLGLLPFASALVGYVEATRDSIEDKNRLCPAQRQPQVPLDWVKGTLVGMRADYLWLKEPDIADWLERSRLNPARGVRDLLGDPKVLATMQRYATSVRPALAKLRELVSAAEG
jgi:hypothetical protein